MLKALRHPLPISALLPASMAIVASVALYCIAYTALSGRSEPLGEAVMWAVVNILPWFLALEAAKRAPSFVLKAGVLVAALIVSMLLAGLPVDPGFELVRRLPALMLVIALLALGRLPLGPPQRAIEIPLLPRQIDWVSAAGNYVELHGSGRTIIHRSSLSSVEADLAAHGFVRIHRSTLVRRDAVARVRPNDVVLADGTSLPTGKRYRFTLH
jgi:hypothetical protein